MLCGKNEKELVIVSLKKKRLGENKILTSKRQEAEVLFYSPSSLHSSIK